MFDGWENFYVIVGSAAGALIGVMFIVATLTAGRDPRQISRGSRVYVTPIVFHFSVVLVVSAVAEMPKVSSSVIATVLALAAAAGFSYSAVTTIRMLEPDWVGGADMWDRQFYGIIPMVAYLALAASSGVIWFVPAAALYATAATML